MTASYWAQVKLNLWKSWLVRKRKPVLWTFEILSPLCMMCIVALVHLGWGPSQLNTCYFRSRANPSAGMVPYLQSSLCNVVNRCRPEDTFEDVPTYFGSKLPDLIQYGSPLFYDEKVQAGIESLEVMVKILDGAAETFNTSFWEIVLEDESQVRDWFHDPERITDFLENQSQTMDEDLAEFFLNSTLSLSQVISQLDLSQVENIACNPELLGTFIISHDVLALQEFANGLCGLSGDQVVNFIEVLHHNLNFESILKTIGQNVELLLNYDVYSGVRDLAAVEGSIVNITDLVGEVEPIFHFDYWMSDFTKLLRSILEKENPYNWEILDRWAELTLANYLDPALYNDILVYVVELTNVLNEVVEDEFPNNPGNFSVSATASRLIVNEEATGPWASLALALEHLIRNVIQNGVKCGEGNGQPCQPQTTFHISKAVQFNLHGSMKNETTTAKAYDYLDYFLNGLIDEFESGTSFILGCIASLQPVVDTSIITYSNLLVLGEYLRYGWPTMTECLNEFEDYFEPPSFVDIESLSETICSLNALIQGEIQWDSGIEDPLIETIVDMIHGDVPRSNTTSDALVEKIERIISDALGYQWPSWNPYEFDETLTRAEQNWQNISIYDTLEITQDLLNLLERLLEDDDFFVYTNATVATQNEFLKIAMEFAIDALENMDQEYIYISISDFLLGFASLDEFVESVAQVVPYLANSWSDLLIQDRFHDITNGIYALILDPEYSICEGNASIRDVWEFPIEADPFIDEFEAGICDFDGVLGELNNSSLFQNLEDIWSSPDYQFEWAELGARSEVFVSQVIELVNASENRTVVIDYVDEDFNRAVLKFLDNTWEYWKGLFHSEFDQSTGKPNSNEDVVHCLTINLPCLNSQSGRFSAFISRLISDFEAQTGILSALEQDGGYFYARIVPQIVITGPLSDFLQPPLVEDDLIAMLMDSGLSEEASEAMGKSFLNLNRAYFASQNPGIISQSIYEDSQKFARLFKFANATLYERTRLDIVRSNLTEIASTLEQSISVDKIVAGIETMRKSQFEDFTWIKPFVGLSDGIVNDVKDLIFHVSYLVRTLSNPEMEQDMVRALLQILKQESVGEVLDGIFGLVTSVELLIGNTKISTHMDEIRQVLEDLEFIQALRGIQFQLKIQSLFDPWDVVESYLEQELNMTTLSGESLGESLLDLPKLVFGNSGHSNNTIIDYVCDPTLLDDYLIPPIDIDDPHWDIADISLALCNVTAGQSLNLSIAMIEEINIEDFLREFLSLSLNNILGPQNISEIVGKEALDAFFEATTILSRNYMDDINHLADSFQDLFNDTSLSPLNLGGIVACGDPLAFYINLDIPGMSGDVGEDNEWIPPLVTDQCTNFRKALSQINGGSFIWTVIASFFQGQILYTPSNWFTDNLAKEMNISYYQKIEAFQEGIRIFLTIADRAEELSKFPEDFAVYDFLIHSPVFKALVLNLYPTFDLELLEDLSLLEIISNLVDYESIWTTLQTVRYAVECYHLDRFASASSEEELERMAVTLNSNQSFQAGIVFLDQSNDEEQFFLSDADVSPTHVKYKIRLGKGSVPSSAVIKAKLWVPGPDDNYFFDLKYVRGFVQLQDLVDRAILTTIAQLTNSTDLSDVGVYTQQFPYPCFERDNYLSGLYTVQIVQICLFLGYAITLASSVRFQVWEKESQNMEIMQVMGMRRSIPWIVWLLISGATMIFSSILLTILLKFSGILPRTNGILLFALLFFYVLSLLAFCMVLALVMKTAVVASVVAVLLYLVTFIPFVILLLVEDHALWPKILTNLFMSSSFSYGALYLTRYEQQAIGLHWDNVWTSPMGKLDNWSFGIACCFVLLDAVLYAGVAIFILWWQRKSWDNQKADQEIQKPSLSRQNPLSRVYGMDAQHDNKVIGISMKNITKDYPMLKNQTKRAVNNLTMDLYEDEITVLLGHNGAGKSTTMKLLTGMETVTSGNIEICGFSYPDEWTQIQTKIGFCPQQSVLFPDLSTREHLVFYAKLKGLHDLVEVEAAIDDLIGAMNIGAAQHEPVKNLSEGNQRRVCISLAFIGGSKVVILDEPTSGVDPIARRYIWDLITRFKHGRTILMTTHHLDEAEILSDRIAIIHKGELKIDGSLSSLKKQFGDGMHLTIAWKDHPTLRRTQNQLISVLETMFPDAINLSSKEPNERFFVPNSHHVVPPKLHKFMAILEKQTKLNHVEDFKVEGTSLEDIFLHLVTGSGEHMDNQLNASHAPITNPTFPRRSGISSAFLSSGGPSHYDLRTGWPLVLGQVRGLLYKRFKHSTRDWRFLMSSLGLPTLLMILTMFLALLRPTSESPPLLLTPSVFGENTNSFVSFSEESDLNNILGSLISDPGIGTTCMKDVPDLGFWTPCQTNAGETNFTTEYGGPGSKLEQCSCPSTYEWTCRREPNSSLSRPPRMIMNTTDVIFDLTHQPSPNHWILNSHTQFIDKRFGGWSIGEPSPSSEVIGGTTENLIVWYNNKGKHAVPSYLNAIHNAMLRATVTEGGQDPAQYGITTYNQPISLNAQQATTTTIIQSVADFGIALMMLTAFSFVPSSFVSYAVTERTQREKQVQFVAGVAPLTYWCATFIWNLGVILVYTILTGIILQIFGIGSYTAKSNFSAVLVLMFFFLTASTSLVCCVEKWFSEPSLGQLTLLCSNILLGILLLLIIILLDMFYAIKSAVTIRRVLNVIFKFVPAYALGGGLLSMASNYITSELLESAMYNSDGYKSPFSFDVIGLNILILCLETFFFFGLNLVVEYKLLAGWWTSPVPQEDLEMTHEDSDVKMERHRVESQVGTGGDHSSLGLPRVRPDLLRITHLSKAFGSANQTKLAVNNVSVGIKYGECFGWIGLNGAGKSTTFKVLTGELQPSSGEYQMNPPNTLRGYCPQENALDPLLTVRETLQVYCQVRGLRSRDSKRSIDQFIFDLALETHENSLCKDLSGGTKRKVCAAVAFLGQPKLILMDEPTSGMDAVIKRQVWKTIQRLVARGTTVILTTHSMEECEQLCNRLSIMAEGQLKCIGSPDHVKNKFGQGFKVQMSFESISNVERALSVVRSQFQGITNVSQHYTNLSFNIQNMPRSKIFAFLVPQQERLGITDLNVASTTLDEVFVSFATGPKVYEPIYNTEITDHTGQGIGTL
ncbi:retinal-specific phospholipid-transporting ATPase ABCA4-like [Tigriopus californicus]|uniref:retinal-specific phospholipid-transporting ATPase ABCA4-like n=1 Tax=Tigriopus californicus TaxID=6832 RepID=UPI0027D9CFBB|nr:retinal-specific phospholipid-transporting ATPase ABCA4-like [Tigriopus californicus]